MRKDVRFGLTIGAILLAVLVVYVLVVPGDDPTSEQVTLVTLEGGEGTAPEPDPTVIEPSVLDTPVAEIVPSPAPQDMAVITPGQVGESIASTRTPEQVMAPSGQWDWENILNTGSMLAATSERRTSVGTAGSAGSTRTVGAVGTVGTADRGSAVAAPAVNSAPAGVPATAGTYTVQPGDNFSVIAQKLYGSARHYTAIEQANPGVDSRRLQVGQVIRVPDRDSVVSTPAVSTVAAVETAPASVDTSRQYRVQPNDSLYKIAQTLYGDGSRWEEIYQINRQAIGENPANLKVGQVLALPEAPAQSAAR